MKKVKIILIAAVVLSLIAASAYATSTVSAQYTFSGLTMTFAPSSNVQIVAVADDTAYAAASKHLNGDKQYGAMSTDSKLQWKASLPGVTAPDAPQNSTTMATGFTAL